ncbi:MAG: S1C family serine protease [Planctomycetota bacterium]|jgi:hypothetical protein
MKTATSLLLMLALACSVAHAQADEDKSPPAKPARTVGYLGVHTGPVEQPLRSQLDLPDGVGLLVRHVDPEAPAAKAGVKEFDVLHKLDQQILINPDQLAVLVRIHKPGRQVKLTIVRKAQPVVVPVTLGSRKITEPPAAIERWRRRIPRRFPPEWVPRPRWKMPPAPQLPKDWDEQMRDLMERYMRDWYKDFRRQPHRPAKPRVVPKPKVPVKPKDDRPRVTAFTLKTPKYTITVRGVDGDQRATVVGSDGKVLHKDVPAEKWDTLPDDVRKLLKGIRIEKGNGGARVKVRI